MGRTLEIGNFKLVTEKNKHNAYKATLFKNGEICSEFYGQTEYTAIVKVIRPVCEGLNTTALLIMLLQIGFEDGYEGEDMSIYQDEFKDLYSDTVI